MNSSSHEPTICVDPVLNSWELRVSETKYDLGDFYETPWRLDEDLNIAFVTLLVSTRCGSYHSGGISLIWQSIGQMLELRMQTLGEIDLCRGFRLSRRTPIIFVEMRSSFMAIVRR